MFSLTDDSDERPTWFDARDALVDVFMEHAGKNARVASRYANTCMKCGIRSVDDIANTCISDIQGKYGVGPALIDALVCIGATDDRPVHMSKDEAISCWDELFSDVVDFIYGTKSLDIDLSAYEERANALREGIEVANG